MSPDEIKSVSEDQDWRLEAKLDVASTGNVLGRLIGHPRGSDVVGDIEAAMPNDVLLTYEKELLFAYATSESILAAARRVIESVLYRKGVKADISISHWDDAAKTWYQTDPPIAEDKLPADAGAVETRTLVANVGKPVCASFEQTMLDWANTLGVECTIAEHPHLLTTQITFTATGPSRKLDEFSQQLRVASKATTVAGEALRRDGM
jgi:hypothetical protein